MPRKTFNAGDVLTAGDVNTFLMDQSVMTFTDSTARESAIGSAVAVEGMLTYLEDTNAFEYWNGTAFEGIVPAPAGGSGLTKISTVTGTGVTSISVDDVFSATYKNYKILIQTTTGSTAELRLRMRTGGSDNTASSYFTAFTGRTPAGGTPTLNEGPTTSMLLSRNISAFFHWEIYLANPFLADKTILLGQSYNDQAGDMLSGGAVHGTTSAFTGFTLFATSGNLNNTTITVFGFEA